MAINRVAQWQVDPDEVLAFRQERQRDGHLAIQITHEYVQFAGSQPGNCAIRSNVHDAGRRWLECHQMCDVSPGTVREVSLCLDANVIGRLKQELRSRGHFETSQTWTGRSIVQTPGRDPVPNDAVFLRIKAESWPAFVTDSACSFQQQQTIIRMHRVSSPSQRVASECNQIGTGRFATQRELEPALAVQISVAGSRVAPGPRENGSHFLLIGDVCSMCLCAQPAQQQNQNSAHACLK